MRPMSLSLGVPVPSVTMTVRGGRLAPLQGFGSAGTGVRLPSAPRCLAANLQILGGQRFVAFPLSSHPSRDET